MFPFCPIGYTGNADTNVLQRRTVIMAPRVKVPEKEVLRRWRDAGYTQPEMVELIWKEYGEKVGRSTVARAMVRYGLSEPGQRYEEFLPWKLNPIHAMANPIRMLRFMGRDELGPERGSRELNDRERDMLNAWLADLKAKKLIVAYDPEDPVGFYFISSKHKDHRGKAPIRRKPLWMAAEAKPTRRGKAKSGKANA